MTGAPQPAPPRPPAGASRYGWAVGVLVVIILAYITLNTLHNEGSGPGIRTGHLLPPFAVPLVASSLVGDANVAAKPGKGAGKSGHVTACEVTDRRALNLCRAAAGRDVVLAFVSIRQADSVRQLEAMQAEVARFPRVRFLAVFLRGSRSAARKAVARHRWTFPLGWDDDGAVAALYGVTTLPTVVLADRRRRARATVYREIPAPELARRLRTVLGA